MIEGAIPIRNAKFMRSEQPLCIEMSTARGRERRKTFPGAVLQQQMTTGQNHPIECSFSRCRVGASPVKLALQHAADWKLRIIHARS
jgi:hypothetical protein